MDCSYIDHMGNDESVVNAARVSFSNTDDGDRTDEENFKLIRYLAKHNHWTPFAHTCITLRVSAPLPIRTQCFKHKQGFVENEESRRYIDSEPTFFMPKKFRKRPEGSIKQGSGELMEGQMDWAGLFNEAYEECLFNYNVAIELGMCPEQARLLLPQGTEVNWYWTGSLSAYARFYKQRTDSHAQVEIQELAKMVGEIIQPLFPVSWEQLTK